MTVVCGFVSSKNSLARYLEKRGIHATRELCALVLKKRKKTIRWATIHDIAQGRATPRPETARLLHEVTGGEIDAGDLLGLTATQGAA